MSEIECPYCGTDNDSQHLTDDGIGQDDEKRTSCDACGKEFFATASYDITFYCKTIEAKIVELDERICRRKKELIDLTSEGRREWVLDILRNKIESLELELAELRSGLEGEKATALLVVSGKTVD